VIGFFGNQDQSPSPAVVTKFEEDMATAGKKLVTHKYNAGHGFANPSNPSFNKEATADAHQKTLAFLKARL
jgi:carboxymethylenebutenolidase